MNETVQIELVFGEDETELLEIPTKDFEWICLWSVENNMTIEEGFLKIIEEGIEKGLKNDNT